MSILRDADDDLEGDEELNPMEIDRISKQICKKESFK